MIKFKYIRLLHKWPGIIFLFPAFLISITSIFLALDGVLNLNSIKISTSLWPNQVSNPEVKAVCFTPSMQFIGSKNGLIVVEGDSSYVVPELSGYDIRNILAVGNNVFISAKQGLWRYQDKKLVKIQEKDIHSISQYSDSLIAISLGKKGFEIIDFNGKPSGEAGEWKNNPARLALVSTKQPRTLRHLVMGLHTGEAIVGKSLEPYWVGLCGLQLLMLTITGFWFVFKKKKKVKLTGVSPG